MRPALHHTVPTGWINDPYGLAWRDGAYHLYFQLVPDSTAWSAQCHWGHSVSPDLLTWTHEGVVLAPDDSEDGCWSGSVVGDLAFYTAVSLPDLGDGRVRSVSLASGARSDVLVTSPPGATDFRDPYVFADGDGWRMLVGCGTADEAAVWSYSSPDLATWTPDGRYAARSPALAPYTGRGWECPQLLSVDGAPVLVVSVWEPDTLHHVAYRVGETWQRLTYGPSYYAASAFTDAAGRPGLVAWLREVAGDGWAGATSLPMSVTLDGDRMVARPPDALLGRRVTAEAALLPLAADLEWAPSAGDALASTGFTLTAGPGSVTLVAGEHTVELPWAGEVLRLVLDGPVLELYGDLGVAAAPVDRPAPAALTSTGAEPLVYALTV